MAKRGGELSAALRAAAAAINGHLASADVWRAAFEACAAGEVPHMPWPDMVRQAQDELAASILTAAVRITVRRWIEHGQSPDILDFEHGPADAAIQLTFRRQRPDGAVAKVETEVWLRCDLVGAQLVLLLSLQAAEKGYAAAVAKVGHASPDGLHDLRNAQRRRRVLEAWRAVGNVAKAATIAGVSLAAAYRIINRRNEIDPDGSLAE